MKLHFWKWEERTCLINFINKPQFLSQVLEKQLQQPSRWSKWDHGKHPKETSAMKKQETNRLYEKLRRDNPKFKRHRTNKTHIFSYQKPFPFLARIGVWAINVLAVKQVFIISADTFLSISLEQVCQSLSLCNPPSNKKLVQTKKIKRQQRDQRTYPSILLKRTNVVVLRHEHKLFRPDSKVTSWSCRSYWFFTYWRERRQHQLRNIKDFESMHKHKRITLVTPHINETICSLKKIKTALIKK